MRKELKERKGEKEKESKEKEHGLETNEKEEVTRIIDKKAKAYTSEKEMEANPLKDEHKDDTFLLKESKTKSIQEDLKRRNTVDTCGQAIR